VELILNENAEMALRQISYIFFFYCDRVLTNIVLIIGEHRLEEIRDGAMVTFLPIL
jgi:hypothetical protein